MSLKTSRLLLKRFLQFGDGIAAFYDGMLDCAMAHLLPHGACKIALCLHDAQDRPADRIQTVPLAEISFRLLNLKREMATIIFFARSSCHCFTPVLDVCTWHKL